MSNILHITGLHSKKYGSIEKWMVHLVNICKERNHQIIFSLGGKPKNKSFLSDLYSAGALVDIMPMEISGLSMFKYINNLINAYKVNIIHSHFSPSCHYAHFAGCLSGLEGRYWTKHSMSEIDKHSFFRRKIITFKQLISSSLVQKLITVSDAIKKDYIKIGVNPNKIIKIPLGIDINKYYGNEEARNIIRKEFRIDDKTILIGTVSRAEHVKGLKNLVEAMSLVIKRNTSVKALIVGGGSLMLELQKKATEFNISHRLIFEGIRDNIPDVLSAMDIFVLPSLSEGLPLALLEAMATGKPVIGSNVGGIPELIEDGVNGYLVAPANPVQLSEAIIKLALNPELANAMGRSGKLKAEENYNVRDQTEKLVDVYEQRVTA